MGIRSTPMVILDPLPRHIVISLGESDVTSISTNALFISTYNGSRCKMFSTKSFLKKNDFLENIFQRLARKKKLRKAKI
jgi:hypothetical protein